MLIQRISAADAPTYDEVSSVSSISLPHFATGNLP